MATQNQLAFVAEIEAAVTAMTMDRNPVGVKLTEVCETAGCNIHDFQGLVYRLANKRNVELLTRLQAALGKVGIQQTTIERKLAALANPALESPGNPGNVSDSIIDDELKLEPTLPVDPVPIQAAETRARRSEKKPTEQTDPDDEIEVLTRVLRILRPLGKNTQKSVIMTAATHFKVGVMD